MKEREKLMTPETTNGIISWDAWEQHYKPIGVDPEISPLSFIIEDVYEAIELAGKSEEAVKHVWTVVDNNPGGYYLDVLPGYRVFNRMGYFVTAEKWEDVDLVVSNDPSYHE
jgi:hypothetical protein